MTAPSGMQNFISFGPSMNEWHQIMKLPSSTYMRNSVNQIHVQTYVACNVIEALLRYSAHIGAGCASVCQWYGTEMKAEEKSSGLS